MSIMFHGSTLYAVYGRNASTFGGRAKNPSLKIYDTRNCGVALVELTCIPNNALVERLRHLRGTRAEMQDYLQRIVTIHRDDADYSFGQSATP